MLNVSVQKQADPNIDTFGGKYNEVIIDSAEYRDQLPASIAAVFFTQESECATRTHREIIDAYGIDPGQVLLLEQQSVRPLVRAVDQVAHLLLLLPREVLGQLVELGVGREDQLALTLLRDLVRVRVRVRVRVKG